jgi:signal transduction histidine kinase
MGSVQSSRGVAKGTVFVAALLLLLLVALAWLQYRWTGAVSRAEEERMKASLQSSLARFDQDFDEELVRVFRFFSIASRAEIETTLTEWRQEAHDPDLVEEVLLLTVDAEGGLELQKSEAGGSFLRASWPPELAPIRDRIERYRHSGGFRGMPPLPLVWGEALIVPLRGEGRSRSRSGDAVLVRLRREALARLLPQLASRHFGSKEALDYEVVVVDEKGEVLFSSAENPASIVERADASSPLFSPMRTQGRVMRRPGGGPPPPPRPFGREGRPPPEMREHPDGHWRIFVRHEAGSLEAAVGRARFRNLAVGFGVLGVLAASVVFLTISARRATELSERKMEFVAGVSHELRTPLAVIRSAAQNLADGSVSEGEQVRRYGALVDAESRRLEDLVEQVLELSGIQSQRRNYHRAPLSCREIVASALSDCAAAAKERGIRLETVLPSEERFVLGEKDALRRALANLVMNAIKHGGDENVVTVSVQSRDGSVVFSVSDRGPGIPQKELPHLFEAFFRGGRARELQVPGSGLGLSLVEHVTKAHGGTLEVSSVPGRGSRFSIALPESSGGG